MARALSSRRAEPAADVITNRPEYRYAVGPLAILLLDALNTPVQDQAHARMEMLKYLDKALQPGQQVAVYTLVRSLRMFARFHGRSGAAQSGGTGSILRFPWSCRSPISIKDCRGCPGAEQIRAVRPPRTIRGRHCANLQEFYEDQANLATDERVGITLTAFREIAQAVAACRGEKVWCGFRGAFPIATYTRVIQYSADAINDPNSKRSNELLTVCAQADSILTDAQVAVYAVDARGLVGQLLGGAGKQRAQRRGTLVTGAEYGQNSNWPAGPFQDSQATMKTGGDRHWGQVFINQNDLDHSWR